MSLERKFEKFDSPQFVVRRIEAQGPVLSPYHVVIVPGFANDASAYSLPAQVLSYMGFNVLCPDYKFGVKGEPKKLGIIPDVDKLKQYALNQIIEEYGYKNESGAPEVNLLAHSNGVRNAIDFALSHLSNVRSIVLVAPGGLRNPDKSFLESYKDYKKAEQNDAVDKEKLVERRPDLYEKVMANEAYKVEYKKQKLHYLVEGLVMINSAVQDTLPRLKASGIRIGVISPLQDRMFPLEEYAEFMTTNYIDEFLPTQGIHGEIKFSGEIAVDAGNMIKRFEGLA